jgi:hypothetical protein
MNNEWMKWVGVALCAMTTAMILLAQHYWLRGKRLHPTINYVLGLLAIYLPLTALFLVWQHYLVVAALWAVTVVGGAVVVASYLVDGWLAVSARLRAAEGEGLRLREALDESRKVGSMD